MGTASKVSIFSFFRLISGSSKGKRYNGKIVVQRDFPISKPASRTWTWRLWLWGFFISLLAGCGLFLATTSAVRSLCGAELAIYGLIVLVWGRETQDVNG